MARKGRVDRGLMMKPDAAGKMVWYVRLYHEGKERRFGSFRTKTEARDFYEKSKQEQRQGRFFPERYQHGGYERMEELLTRHMLTRANKKDQRGERCFLKWWTDRFNGKRLNVITPALLDEARRDLLAKGTSPQRANRYMEWIRHVLNTAVRDGKLTANPAAKLSMFKEPPGRTRYLSLEEEAKLCETIGHPHAGWVRLAILTGLRRAEQFSLRWTDVDLDRGVLTLSTTKAGGVQYLHLNDEAKAILRGIDSWQFSAWVFPSKNPVTHLDPCNFYRRVFLPAAKRLGLENVTWHTLRHTFASRLAMSGATDYDIASCLRHSTTSLVRRYAHLSPTHLRGVMERVSTFGRPSDKPTRTERSTPKQAGDVPTTDQHPNGTVTETVTRGNQAGEKTAEPIENIGAPGRN